MALVLAGILFAEAGAASGLEPAVETYMDALRASRYEAAYALLCNRARATITMADLATVGRGTDVRSIVMGKRGTGVEGVPFLSDRNHVYATLSTSEGEADRRFPLHRESGHWRVCPSDPAGLLGTPV